MTDPEIFPYSEEKKYKLPKNTHHLNEYRKWVKNAEINFVELQDKQESNKVASLTTRYLIENGVDTSKIKVKDLLFVTIMTIRERNRILRKIECLLKENAKKK